MNRILLPLSLFLLSPLLPAQDPKVPPGGFAILPRLDVLLTWSDGYKTRVDIRVPKATPPKNGWPVVACFHGKNHSRKAIASTARYLAAQGYATFAYDWRGNGDTILLNKFWTGTYDWDRIITDAAESFSKVAAMRPGLFDLTRLAMTGGSGGGDHCFDAAAQSEKTLKVPGSVKTYPKILAVAPQIYVPERVDMLIPHQGLLMQTHYAVDLSKNPTNPGWQLAKQGRYDLIYSRKKSQGQASRLDALKKSSVPIFSRMGHDDYRMWPSACFDSLEQLPAGYLFKGLMTTSGHGVPLKNTIEKNLIDDQIRRWFDHFVKGWKNDLLKQPRYEIVVNEFGPDYLVAASEREHRYSDVWPPKTPVTRLYLRSGGTLDSKAPTTAEAGTKILHRVKSGYDITAFTRTDKGGQSLATFQKVTQSIPFVSKAFVGPILQEETELFGRTMVEFSVKSSSGDFQISAALLARDSKNNERYIVGGTTAVRRSSPGVHRLRFALRETAMIVPKGWRLVIRLENLAYYRTPGQHLIEFVPWFQSHDLEILSAPNTSAFVELPIAERGIGLSPRFVEIRTAAGFRRDLHVRMGSSNAGSPYLLYIGTSGFGPGIRLGAEWLPLNIDAWTLLGISLMNTTPFTSFAGLSNAQGVGTATFQLPASASKYVIGRRFCIAALCLPKKGGLKTGGPAILFMQ